MTPLGLYQILFFLLHRPDSNSVGSCLSEETTIPVLESLWVIFDFEEMAKYLLYD